MLQKAIRCGVSLPSPSATVTTSRMPLSLETACVETSLLVVPGDLVSSTVTPAFSHLPFPPCRASGSGTLSGTASLSTCLTVVERERDWVNGPRTLLSVGPRYRWLASHASVWAEQIGLPQERVGFAVGLRAVLPAPAAFAVARPSVYAPASAVGNPPELLHVQVDHVAWFWPLVSHGPACTCGCLSVRARSASDPHRSSIGLS